jgi:putative two-component system response regulator
MLTHDVQPRIELTANRSRQPVVLIVDDDPQIARLLERLLSSEGYAVKSACDGPSALASIADRLPDVVLLDVVIPGINGLDLCRRLKRDSATRLTPIVLITALTAREDRIAGFEAGADEFLSKPIDNHELVTRVRSLVRLKRYTDDLDSASSIIMTLATMIEARDGCSEGHCHRLANYATALGRSLDLNAEDLQALHRGGFLHDIGMLAIPEPVIRKTVALEPEEYELIKSHTTIGDSLVSNLRSLHMVRPIIRHHHERLDGSGYPDRLSGDDIPLLAQIIGVVDLFDVVTTQRAYQNARSPREALTVLRDQVSRGWRRADLVDHFEALVENGKVT